LASLVEQIAADIAGEVFFDISHGHAITVQTNPGAVSFVSVFSDEYSESELGGEAVIPGSIPTLRCRTADIDALVAVGSLIDVVRGGSTYTYQVTRIQPDGYGETVLYMHLDSVAT